jgi:hypothetical protein
MTQQIPSIPDPQDPKNFTLEIIQQNWSKKILANDKTIFSAITLAPPLAPEERINIYAGGYVGAILQVLREVYPVCLKLVGDRFFEAMGEYFIVRYPSVSPDLHDYGSEFSEFIKTFPPAASLPYLGDVAHLEWLYTQAFHGSDSIEFDLNSLIALDPREWGRIQFHLQPQAFLITSIYPIHRIWEVNQPDYTGDDYVDLGEGGVNLIVWRKGLEMHIDILSDPEYFFLEKISTGSRFEAICAFCLEENISDIQSLLLHSIQQGWIAAYSLQ